MGCIPSKTESIAPTGACDDGLFHTLSLCSISQMPAQLSKFSLDAAEEEKEPMDINHVKLDHASPSRLPPSISSPPPLKSPILSNRFHLKIPSYPHFHGSHQHGSTLTLAPLHTVASAAAAAPACVLASGAIPQGAMKKPSIPHIDARKLLIAEKKNNMSKLDVACSSRTPLSPAYSPVNVNALLESPDAVHKSGEMMGIPMNMCGCTGTGNITKEELRREFNQMRLRFDRLSKAPR